MQCARVRLRDAGICLLNKYLRYISGKSPKPHRQEVGRARHGHICVERALPACPCHTGTRDPSPHHGALTSLQDTLQTHCTTCLCPAGLFNSCSPLQPCPLRPPALTAPLPSPWQPSCQETCLIHLLLMQELNQLLEGCFTSQSNNNISLLQLGKLRHTKRCPRVHWN